MTVGSRPREILEHSQIGRFLDAVLCAERGRAARVGYATRLTVAFSAACSHECPGPGFRERLHADRHAVEHAGATRRVDLSRRQEAVGVYAGLARRYPELSALQIVPPSMRKVAQRSIASRSFASSAPVS